MQWVGATAALSAQNAYSSSSAGTTTTTTTSSASTSANASTNTSVSAQANSSVGQPRGRSGSRSRPGTSSGDQQKSRSLSTGAVDQQPHRPNVLTKERRPSFSRKASFSRLRRGSSSTSTSNGDGAGGRLGVVKTDNSTPPALPGFALASSAAIAIARPPGTPGGGGASSRDRDIAGSNDSAAAPNSLQSPPVSGDSFSKMMVRTAPSAANGYSAAGLTGAPAGVTNAIPGESSMVHQHIQETASKRISTLDYLRKAHEGRVYWFNTLLFEKPDLARMPYFDNRKLARRATNYLLLGLSLPNVIDLNSSTPLEFLRSLNTLLNEFESFQSLHSESGSAASSLSRARLPNMFRRGTQGSKSRRTSSATNDVGYSLESAEPNGGGAGFGLDGAQGSGGGGAAGGGAGGPGGGPGTGAGGANASVLSFAASDNDLLPGEEYTHLLTPSLPFDPDFFETFATLCDVLIDCYTRLLSLVPTPRECSGPIAELFTKADARVRKIIVHGVVKEFEDSSRSGIKNEVANVGKVVLGGLM